MKKSIDDRLNDAVNKEQKVPEVVQDAFQNSYSIIRAKAKRKNRKRWMKPVSVAAASVLIASGLFFSNDVALAKLQAVFGFKDAGIELASSNGDTQYNGETQENKNVKVTLGNTFADAYRVGLQLNIMPTDIDVNDVMDVQVEFRLNDNTGKEIAALVSEDKIIDPSSPVSGIETKTTHDSDGILTLELLLQSNKHKLPSLENSELVIEEIHFSTYKNDIITVDGKWAYSLSPANVQQKSFVANNEVEGLQLHEATLSNGSMHLSLTVDELLDENVLFDITLKDQDGAIYTSSGANVSQEANQTTINLVYPYSIWNEQQQITLSVKGYEDLLLSNK